MRANTRSSLLRDLLITTKDGDWGKGGPESGRIPYRVIRGADFPAAQVGDLSSVPLRYLDSKAVARRTLQPNDILIETAGGTKDRPTGRTLLVTSRLLEHLDHPATCASFARFLRVDPVQADPRFVYWYLQFLYAAGIMVHHQVQHTGVARFQYTRFAETQHISLPPRNEQESIAEILGALDHKIIVNNKLVGHLRRMSALLFERAVALAEAREDIDWLPLSALSETSRIVKTGPFGSNLHASDYAASGSPLVLVKHVLDGLILRDGLPLVDPAKARELNDYSLVEGDIVVTRVGRVGDAAIVHAGQSGWLFSGQMLRVRLPHNSLEPYWLFAFTLTRSFRKQIDNFAVGSTRQSLSVQLLEAIPVPLIPTAQQKSFAITVQPLWEYVESLRDESAQLRLLRDALLTPLVSGQLRVREAESLVEDAAV